MLPSYGSVTTATANTKFSGEASVWPSLVRCISSLGPPRKRHILEPHAEPLPDLGPAPCDTAKELWIALELIFEPIVLRLEADENTRRTPVTSDNDLLCFGQPEVTREIILHFGEGHPSCLGSPEP